MSGAIKAGLIFGLVALIIAVIPSPIIIWGTQLPIWLARFFVQIIPALMLFGPLAMVLGGCAGYVGARWSSPRTAQQGLLAGGLAGGGLLLGILIFFATIVFLIESTPDIRDALVQTITERFAAQGGNGEMVANSFTTMMFAVGLCAGIANLLVALVAGLCAGWLASRPGRAAASDA